MMRKTDCPQKMMNISVPNDPTQIVKLRNYTDLANKIVSIDALCSPVSLGPKPLLSLSQAKLEEPGGMKTLIVDKVSLKKKNGKNIDIHKTMQIMNTHLLQEQLLKPQISKSSGIDELHKTVSKRKNEGDSYAFLKRRNVCHEQLITDQHPNTPFKPKYKVEELFSPTNSYFNRRKRLSFPVSYIVPPKNDNQFKRKESSLDNSYFKSISSYPGLKKQKSTHIESSSVNILSYDSYKNQQESQGNNGNATLVKSRSSNNQLSYISAYKMPHEGLPSDSSITAQKESPATFSNNIFKNKLSQDAIKCSWTVTSDLAFKSEPMPPLSDKESAWSDSVCQDNYSTNESFEGTRIKDIEQEVSKVSSVCKQSVNIPKLPSTNLCDQQQNRSFRNSRWKSSSFVIYDECSSEEEIYWNKSPLIRKPSFQFTSTQTAYFNLPPNDKNSGETYLTSSDSEDDFSPKDYNYLTFSSKKLKIRKIFGNSSKNFHISVPFDIDTISNRIDIRLMGKHDDWVYSSQKKVIILGDSHTRFLVHGMNKIFPGFRIYTFCKPSAKTDQVFSGLSKSISELTKDDFLVILCGTNDMWSESIKPAEKYIANKLRRIKNTNVLVCNVPRNYSELDTSYVQTNISAFNKFLKKTVKNLSNVVLVNLHRLKERFFFTKHGLHFNGTGKVKICELLSHKLVDVLDAINP